MSDSHKLRKLKEMRLANLEKECETISGNNFSNNLIKANWNQIKKVFIKDFKDGSHGKKD